MLQRQDTTLVNQRFDTSWLNEIIGTDASPFGRIVESPLEHISRMEGRDVIMLGSNNYLGLTSHPKIKEAAIEAIRKYGTGFTSSRIINGTTELHLQLEQRLAKFFGTESCLLCSSGYLTNAGVVATVSTPDTYLFFDQRSHSSIVDGVRLGEGQATRFPHNNIDYLRRKLKAVPKFAPKWIVVEGVYSMDGDVCPLDQLAEVGDEFNAGIIVDDAHGLGTLGSLGRGTADHFGVASRIDIITGTFSKSLGSYGGFIVGDKDLLNFIQGNSRQYIFTASLPAANVATALAALDVMETEPEWLESLHSNTDYFANQLFDFGVIDEVTGTPVIPLIVGEQEKNLAAWQDLFKRGVFTNAVFPPGVQPGHSLLRMSLMATTTRDELDLAFERIVATCKELRLKPYNL